MNLKKFSIITSIISAIIIVLVIVLSCITLDGGLDLNSPERIKVYLKEGQGVLYEKEGNNQKFYNELWSRYKKSTNLSIMDYMLHGNVIELMPSQDYQETQPEFTSTDKTENYCLELIWKERQQIIVNIEGDTRVVDFYSLIMVVKKSTLSHKTYIYFSTTDDFEANYRTYSKQPLVINSKQNKLYKYMEYLSTK